MKRPNWPGFVVLATLTMGSVAATASFSQADPSADSARSEARMERLEANTLRLIWWNNETKVETLSLTESQRAAMDDELRKFLRTRRTNAVAQREAYEAFGAALGVGDEAAAREAVSQVVELMSTPVRLQAEMMINVISLLSNEQRETMVAEWPKLMSSPWVRQNLSRGSVGGRTPTQRKGN